MRQADVQSPAGTVEFIYFFPELGLLTAALWRCILHCYIMVRMAAVGGQLAVSHLDGNVRLWALDQGICDVTFKGHRGAVSALCYSQGGAMLASGGRDTDIVIWDVPGETGLFRLRGHTNEVTSLVRINCEHQSFIFIVRSWTASSVSCWMSKLNV